MSKARTINDYYAIVFLHRYHKGNPSKPGERIEIVVRIPEDAAKILFGSLWTLALPWPGGMQ